MRSGQKDLFVSDHSHLPGVQTRAMMLKLNCKDACISACLPPSLGFIRLLGTERKELYRTSEARHHFWELPTLSILNLRGQTNVPLGSKVLRTQNSKCTAAASGRKEPSCSVDFLALLTILSWLRGHVTQILCKPPATVAPLKEWCPGRIRSNGEHNMAAGPQCVEVQAEGWFGPHLRRDK